MTLYTVEKYNKKNSLKHGSKDSVITLCEKTIDKTWTIINNTGDGQVTCKVCQRKIK